MQPETYSIEADIEATHWWFEGRRTLFARELARAGLRPDAHVLDVGTGTGGNLRLLRQLKVSNVTGLDSNETAIQFCLDKGLGAVHRGDICAMPFADGSFDFVLATDVIEHVDGDAAALSELVRVLKYGGQALLAVPAFPSLWGLQDVVAHHKRRYRMKPLLQKMRAAGLEPSRYYHFNYLLFGPIWLARRLIDLFRIKRDSEAEFNSPALNRFLSAVFAFDVLTAPFLRPPFGVSILALGRKAGTPRR
ncbi:MAG TPA: class I SAM-dependent methyltransferase [Rhizomicrobium sp.]|nr:class I SAM-dependent methyltransferase [Rhizomicrobium sp.]